MCIMYKSNNCTLCNVYDQCQFGHKLVESKFNETWNVSKQVEVGQHLTQHWPNRYPFLVSIFINFHHLCIFVLEWFGHFKIKVLHLALFMIHHASLTWSLFGGRIPHTKLPQHQAEISRVLLKTWRINHLRCEELGDASWGNIWRLGIFNLKTKKTWGIKWSRVCGDSGHECTKS